MNAATLPIATTTSLSILLHGVVILAILYVSELAISEQAVGKGVSIELISSTEVAEQSETDSPKKHLSENKIQAEAVHGDVPENHSAATDINKKMVKSVQILTVKNSDTTVSKVKQSEAPVLASAWVSTDTLRIAEQQLDYVFDNNSREVVVRSTDASQQRHTILELLHSSISNKKVYPYLARRQRREGTSTVAFILHPDGTIEKTQLLKSSQAIMLDRAAISAVQAIEPFSAAQEYLEHAEQFQVDVVFSLL